MEINEIYVGLEAIKRSRKALNDVLPNNEELQRDCAVCGAAQVKLADYAMEIAKRKRGISNEQLDRLARAAWGNHSFMSWEDISEPVKVYYRGIAKRILEVLGVAADAEKK